MNNQKVVLITGASSGIGKATAIQLLEQGYIVYAVARRIEKMKDLKDKGAITFQMDITKEEDINMVVEEISKNHNGVDILVNNAGFGMYGAVEDTSLEDARYQYEVNIFGLAAITKKILPYMREKRAGKIINISSMGGKIYMPMGAWYHSTKHALEGWSDCLRLELKQFNIDVVIIEPGIITTEFGEVMIKPMMERSGNTAYAKLAKAFEKASKDSYKEGNGTPPSQIAKTIVKAIKSKNPKTRYATGKMAKPLIFFRKWLSDKMFDKAVLTQIK